MKRYLPFLLIVLCLAAFAVGVTRLFLLRFGVGDVYPPYSSLRSDPLGAMAFYESLEKLRGFRVRRDFSSANRLPEEKDTTYLQLGARIYDWKWLYREEKREIESFLTQGGRLVLVFHPESTLPFYDNPTNNTESAEKDMKPPLWTPKPRG